MSYHNDFIDLNGNGYLPLDVVRNEEDRLSKILVCDYFDVPFKWTRVYKSQFGNNRYVYEISIMIREPVRGCYLNQERIAGLVFCYLKLDKYSDKIRTSIKDDMLTFHLDIQSINVEQSMDQYFCRNTVLANKKYGEQLDRITEIALRDPSYLKNNHSVAEIQEASLFFDSYTNEYLNECVVHKKSLCMTLLSCIEVAQETIDNVPVDPDYEWKL